MNDMQPMMWGKVYAWSCLPCLHHIQLKRVLLPSHVTDYSRNAQLRIQHRAFAAAAMWSISTACVDV